jgi:hypothetical protein
LTAIAYGRRRVAHDYILRTAARGAILIGIAVVIGIVLLQVVDEGGSVGGPSASGNGVSRTTTTSGTGAHPVQEVSVLVLNGSGVPQAANTKAAELRALGYPIVGAENAPQIQNGTTVQCRAGYEQEATALAKAVDPSGAATTGAFPDPAPAGSESAICIVTVGK